MKNKVQPHLESAEQFYLSEYDMSRVKYRKRAVSCRQQFCILRMFYEGMPRRKIAKRLNISMAWVYEAIKRTEQRALTYIKLKEMS